MLPYCSLLRSHLAVLHKNPITSVHVQNRLFAILCLQHTDVDMASSSPSTSANVASAVSFLRDPSVRDSPLSKKLAFLESKGLSPQEIDAALRQSGNVPAFTTQQLPYGQPPLQQRQPDWRDWFIMATVGGAVGTVAYSLARVRASTLPRDVQASNLTFPFPLEEIPVSGTEAAERERASRSSGCSHSEGRRSRRDPCRLATRNVRDKVRLGGAVWEGRCKRRAGHCCSASYQGQGGGTQ